MRKVLNPMGKWCGLPCMECDESYRCYKKQSEVPIERIADEPYDELHDVLEEDYSEDSTP